MSEQEFPYNLPIWRRIHRAASPDGMLIAQIDPAHEVAMGMPTSGILCVSNGLHLARCNPSFVWSDDSKFLAVPQYFMKFGILRRQRLVLISFEKLAVYASNASTCFYQPESFEGGRLVASTNPFGKKKHFVEYQIPADLPNAFFRDVWARWPETGRDIPVIQPLKKDE